MRSLLIIPLLALAAACGGDSEPESPGSASSASTAVATDLPLKWRGLLFRRFRSPGPPAIEVLDIIPADGTTGWLLSATLKPSSGSTSLVEARRNEAEARASEGAWLLEWPARDTEGPLDIVLVDESGESFSLRIE